MKTLVMITGLLTFICFGGAGFAAHQEEKEVPKGTVTSITAIEYEVTIKDDAGKETKVKAGDIQDVKVGDRVIVTKDGRLKKAVKPIAGGY